ncbi:hypothetical protein ACIHFB_44405 [Streptomyces sp. NPDC051963]|uniref:hypothetical protein n=1 Tax=Streptomyces sp. NPDC051963 TaxID=3365678 RepID=UPI0037D44360
MAPILAAAAAGLAARHAGGAHAWGLLKEAFRFREAVRAERERHAGLVALVERLPPGSRLVVRQEPGGRRSMEIRTEPRPPTPDRCSTP